LQAIVTSYANEIGRKVNRLFYPIYFDMLWNDRYKRGMGNLFELNP